MGLGSANQSAVFQISYTTEYHWTHQTLCNKEEHGLYKNYSKISLDILLKIVCNQFD